MIDTAKDNIGGRSRDKTVLVLIKDYLVCPKCEKKPTYRDINENFYLGNQACV